MEEKEILLKTIEALNTTVAFLSATLSLSYYITKCHNLVVF